MKAKIIIPIVAFAGAIALSGCKPSETKITGQVFIATSGGMSVRLGAVEVRVIEKQQAIDFIRKRRSEIPAAKQELEKAQRDYNSSVEAMSEELKPLEAQLEQLRAEKTRLRDAGHADNESFARAELVSGAGGRLQTTRPTQAGAT